jgi:hypothetical protein
MVWFIALLCLGLVGVTGYYTGPVRAGFSFLGLVLGALLAGPLSPLTRHLLPLFGLKHPAWGLFVPQAIAFLAVLIIFKIAGHVLHEKISVYFKYKVTDERKLISWRRLYSRLGLCVGLLNGAVYFILLMIPVYAGGYFTTEAAGEGAPTEAQLLTNLRAQLGSLKMDRVVAAYDPTPRQVYQAADIVSLVLHNPLLESRLAHYPTFLQLGERKDFQELATDVTLQQLIAEGRIIDVINHPKVQAMLTNAAITSEISAMIGNDLDDLQQYLTTGQSAKFDSETILGIWTVNRGESLAQERRRHPGLTPVQLRQLQTEMFPIITGLSLTALPNQQMLLKKLDPTSLDNSIVATGTWKRDGAAYQVNLPGSRPETSVVEIPEKGKLLLPKDSYVLVFDKEM